MQNSVAARHNVWYS